MIRSMTGYAEAALDRDELHASVSVRALNHRFFDLTLHLPRRLQPLEAEARAKAAVLAGPDAAAGWLPHGGVVVFDDGSHVAVS